jgi:hypothetical protein
MSYPSGVIKTANVLHKWSQEIIARQSVPIFVDVVHCSYLMNYSREVVMAAVRDSKVSLRRLRIVALNEIDSPTLSPYREYGLSSK